jgi:peroxiredoxin-like protein
VNKNNIMQSVHHIEAKNKKQFVFEVELNWLVKKRGILSANNVNNILHVATPPEFGGEGREWSPEHLFLSSVSSCFMSTYIFFTQKPVFGITNLNCTAIGHVEMVDGKYQFTRIDLFPKINIATEEAREEANLALEKTKKYCLISNSIKTDINYSAEIIADMPLQKVS